MKEPIELTPEDKQRIAKKGSDAIYDSDYNDH